MEILISSPSPAGQIAHTAVVFAPMAELYRPATHPLQVSAAAVKEYFPASHSVQLEDAEEL